MSSAPLPLIAKCAMSGAPGPQRPLERTAHKGADGRNQDDFSHG